MKYMNMKKTEALGDEWSTGWEIKGSTGMCKKVYCVLVKKNAKGRRFTRMWRKRRKLSRKGKSMRTGKYKSAEWNMVGKVSTNSERSKKTTEYYIILRQSYSGAPTSLNKTWFSNIDESDVVICFPKCSRGRHYSFVSVYVALRGKTFVSDLPTCLINHLKIISMVGKRKESKCF